MKVFTCTTFAGFNPVGSAAVVVAESHEQAVTILREALISHGIRDDQDGRLVLEELYTFEPSVRILCDGDY